MITKMASAHLNCHLMLSMENKRRSSMLEVIPKPSFPSTSLGDHRSSLNFVVAAAARDLKWTSILEVGVHRD